MAVDTKVSTLIINKLTQAQYDELKEAGQLSETELYITTDTNDVIPDQTDNAGKVLTTNGNKTSWDYTTIINDMVNSTETGMNKLVINKLTKAQYEELQNAGTINPDEIYLTEDTDEVTKLSQLENDAGFITSSEASSTYATINSLNTKANSSDVYTKTEVDAKVSSVYRYKGTVANYNSLPTTNLVTGDVYNVDDTGANYAYNGTTWDKLSETIDLTPYLTKTEASSTYATIDSLGTTTNKVSELETELAKKANQSTTYTKTEVDNLITSKASTTYVDEELAKKANQETTYTKSEVDELLSQVGANITYWD